MEYPTEENVLRPTEQAALHEWRRLVEADREQVERVRERTEGEDFYAPVAAAFSPGRRESLEWPVLQAFAKPEDTWIDIGAGGGRFAVPLAGMVRRVIAVEPSGSMRATMAAAADEAGRTNIEVVDAYWPAAGWSETADVTLAAHSTYDIDDIASFLDEMERFTRRTCIALFGCRARGAQLADLFEAVHGEPMATLPSLREFVALLGARGRRTEVRTAGRGDTQEPPHPAEEAYATARRLLWLAEGTEKDARMRALIDEWYGTSEGVALPSMRPWVGVVSWEPARA
ncbi:MAG: class I SAM-dependent methyltransferase [Dehalococcoidia bacterium]|nr:class I SAM-dependent methyltransferase [Dehalococcoidia bacterium]